MENADILYEVKNPYFALYLEKIYVNKFNSCLDAELIILYEKT